MTNFAIMSDAEIVAYIDRNFRWFANERSDEFPDAQLGSLHRGRSFIIRRAEGFAMVRDGLEAPFNLGSELMFLHVSPGLQGSGIGQQLVDDVKNAIGYSVPIELTCESTRRRQFFERCGFLVARYHPSHDLYEMVWIPD